MDSSITRAYDLTVLGIRVFYTPVPEMAQPTESEFSYCSSSNFTAFFRNVKGMTPSEFRKNLQNY